MLSQQLGLSAAWRRALDWVLFCPHANQHKGGLEPSIKAPGRRICQHQYPSIATPRCVIVYSYTGDNQLLYIDSFTPMEFCECRGFSVAPIDMK